MQVIHTSTDKQLHFPLHIYGDPARIAFFDIETTGFSAEKNTLYLIGCVYQKDDIWQTSQWFADQTADEKEILLSFLEFMKDFDLMITFNGQTFDLPFIQKKCTLHGLDSKPLSIDHLDIYRKIFPYKNQLAIPDLKLKTVEAFLGIIREDKYTGKQLIKVYKDYLKDHQTARFDCLILHNYEDIIGMLDILPVLAYDRLASAAYQVDTIHITESIYQIQLKSDCMLPAPLRLTHQNIQLFLDASTVTIRGPLYTGELKYFYPDYKNYYYLPIEDEAIHKSIAAYVDKEYRKKATPATCYTKKTGTFLPFFSEESWPVFKDAYDSPSDYILLENFQKLDDQSLINFARHLIIHCL